MNLRSLLLTLALAMLAAFAIANWNAFMAPTMLSLVFAEVQAPLGLIMLVVTGAMTMLFLGYIVFQQAGVILEARRYAKELKSHRELADKAEASRFTELRAYLETELRRLDGRVTAQQEAQQARADRLEQALIAKLAETSNTLSAYIGEVEEKLDRALKDLPLR
jgi:uncharacterized integral membrane protein